MAEVNDFNVTDASNTARFPEGMDPAAVNNGMRADEGIIARWHKDTNASLVSTGSANAYALAINSTDTLYDGQILAFEANFANTGACTLNVTPSGGAAQGAKAIRKNYNAALASGDIAAGQKVMLVYDLAEDFFQVLSNLPSSEAAASTTTAGIVELATTAETATGTDATRAVTPDGLHDMTTLSGAAWLLDEDDMASNSAVLVASQQSIKAYVDGKYEEDASQATTSGTTKDFTAGSANAREAFVVYDNVSTDGTSDLLIQLGDAGGIETTSYDGRTNNGGALMQAHSAGFVIGDDMAAGDQVTGMMHLVKIDDATNKWACTFNGFKPASAGADMMYGAGIKSLSADITTIRITSASADTFDNGSCQVLWKY